jgi:hypothetical protein
MTTRPDVDAAPALAAAAEAGPYFALDPWTGAPDWRPLSVLIADPAVLAERAEHARAALARSAGTTPSQVEQRAAASILFLGVASRLLSPSLAAAVLRGVVPDLTADTLWWRPAAGPLPLATRMPRGADVGDLARPGPQLGDAAALIAERCVAGLAGPLLAAFETQFRVSPQVLWGNVASALAGAAGTLAETFPVRAEAAGQLTALILAQGPLRGTGELARPDAAVPRRFLVRRSCCLFYRVPGGGMCGDCVLVPDEARHQQWQAVLARSALRR